MPVALIQHRLSMLCRALGRQVACISLLMLACLLLWALPAQAQTAAGVVADEAPLVIGQRTVFVFRAPLGAFTPADRAASAQQRIQRVFDEPGEGWTSVKPQPPGLMVEIDGKPLFLVLPEDLPRSGQGESVDAAANAASRVLQTAWRESREVRDSRASLASVLRVLLAIAVLVVAWLLVWRLSRRVHDAISARVVAGVQALPDPALVTRISPIVLSIASRLSVLLAWLVSLVLLFLVLAYSLEQFVLTRAMGEGLFRAFSGLLVQGLGATAAAVPGLFVAITIFLLAWIGTQVSAEVFKQVAAGRMRLGLLDAHTAPVTRHIVNAALWLFAAAMAYPYLPGAQTEAFKGLTVILGLMVSIGASGLIGQVASGVILVYTRALSLGDYVRIQDCEGTVTEIGLFVTRLRTGLGAEYALPNAVVVSNVTRNLSRETAGQGCVLETEITIGYDAPWRQVHALLTEAARTVPEILREPAPYVVQTALSDYYVAYRLVCCMGSQDPTVRARVPSALNAAIQDQFNSHGVQIMSPHYNADPKQVKVVPESQWYAAPARRSDAG